MAKKIRTFMILPALWTKFKKHARKVHNQTASARLRDIIKEDLTSVRER